MKIVPTNLSNWKSKVYKLDGDELAPIPVDLSKLSIVVKMMLLKKMYIMLRSKILKIKYWITNLATTAAHTAVEIKIPSLYLDYNTKIIEIEKRKLLLIIIMINVLLLENLKS